MMRYYQVPLMQTRRWPGRLESTNLLGNSSIRTLCLLSFVRPVKRRRCSQRQEQLTSLGRRAMWSLCYSLTSWTMSKNTSMTQKNNLSVQWLTQIDIHINKLKYYGTTETPWVDAWKLRYKFASLCARSGNDYCGPAERLPIPTSMVSPAVGRMVHDSVPIFKNMNIKFDMALQKYSHPKEANIFMIGEERVRAGGSIVMDVILAAFALPDRTLRLDITTSGGDVEKCVVDKNMEQAKVYSFQFTVRESLLMGYRDNIEACRVSLKSSLASSISRRPLFLSSPDYPAAPVDITGLVFSEPPETDMPTSSPTKKPTKLSTKSPTKLPTKFPTKTPTKSPTKTPTESPTKSPTKSPIKVPTTKSPTKSPKPTSVGLRQCYAKAKRIFKNQSNNLRKVHIKRMKTCREMTDETEREACFTSKKKIYKNQIKNIRIRKRTNLRLCKNSTNIFMTIQEFETEKWPDQSFQRFSLTP
mmetsp:Transcript_1558/g.3283  ORF Transcript_1558/g.3283 Transcript_1558/m.3283 type:complete len:471 (-) Transcript_1558:164-1576(-)